MNVVRGEDNPNTLKFEITERIKHPDYKANSIDHDIALFKLDRNVVFNSFVAPICLPHFDKSPDKLIATGWGKQGFIEEMSNDLMKVKLEMFTEEQCQEKYAKSRKNREGINYASKFCAGSFNESKDTCKYRNIQLMVLLNNNGKNSRRRRFRF